MCILRSMECINIRFIFTIKLLYEGTILYNFRTQKSKMSSKIWLILNHNYKKVHIHNKQFYFNIISKTILIIQYFVT